MGVIDDIVNVVQSSIRVADTARIFTKNSLKFIGNSSSETRSMAQLLRKSFEELGATYIKLGQLIASATGLFPKEYVEEMQLCLDQVSPVHFETVKKILEEEFKDGYNKVFLFIDEKPLASASIAQVHAATLVTGEDVVIKVQRPGIEVKLNADLNLLYVSAYVFEKIASNSARASLTGIVKDFHSSIMEEVDFLKEAKNIEEFDDFLSTIGQSQVMVPKVYHQASTKKVLTMQRLHGVALTDLQSIKRLVKDPEKTLILALNTWFQSLMFCGFFHADVHAGNLMVLEDGRLAFIDFGIVGRIKQNIWNALLDLVDGFGHNDYTKIAIALVEMNATDQEIDIKNFAKQLESVFTEFNKLGESIEKSADIGEAQINELMIQLVQASEENGLKIPREFGLLFKQMLYFDRYIRLLAPELNIADANKVQMRVLPK